MTDKASSPIVELRDVSMSYGGVKALDSVNLKIERGQIHALVGENGAGKSTLVRVLTGVVTPDVGTVLIDGREQSISDPHTAQRLGIAAMYQEPTVFRDLSVAENIFVGRRPRGMFGAVDWSAMRREAAGLLTEFGAGFVPDAPVRGLSAADRQLVEIMKALSTRARLLIMDEPTAVLSPREAENLFSIMRRLRDRGVAILFIGHRLEEISAVSDTITVLRDGRHVATCAAGELSHREMIRLMAGRALDDLFPKEETGLGEPVLEVHGLSRSGVFSDVDFEVRRGEIVGLAGFVGAGRSEVARSLFGVDPHDHGEVRIDGRRFVPGSPRGALRSGLAYLPEDRLGQGLVQTMDIASNISVSVLPRLTPGGFLRPGRERQLARRFMERLKIKAASPKQLVSRLSGGTQQKVVLSKWLATEPKVLILDEPTRGVDVSTKAEVHRIISRLARDGLGILLISSDLPEVLGMSDRVLVMSEGCIVAELSREEATSERVMEAAAAIQTEGVHG
jgi:rhamnose transport system ATP-binding protein